MLNHYLPRSKLEHILTKDGLNDLVWILSERGFTKDSILNNLKFLGNLHHAVNIDKYKQPKVRLELLKATPREISREFFIAIGMGKEFKNSQSPSEYEKLVRKASKLKWGNNNETISFVRIFGYPDYLIPRKSTTLDNPEIAPRSPKPLLLLMEYQSRIFFKVSKELQREYYRCLIQMPTGSGKTRTTMEIICQHLNSSQDAQVVWITNRAELLEQAVETFKEVWAHIGTRNIPIYKIWGDYDADFQISGSAFIVIGYDKLNSIQKKKNIDLEPELIVVDEAHQVLAPTYDLAIQNLVDRGKFGTRVIGLTATPGRGFREEENRRLADYFNSNIVHIDSGSQSALKYLQEEGILAYYEKEALPTDFEVKLTKSDWKRLTTMVKGDYPEYSTKILKKMAEDRNRNKVIIKRLEELALEGKQVLYFATSQEQSRFICATLLAMNIKAVHIEGETNKEFRRDIVEKFRNKEITIICNYNIFSVGVDIKKLDVVFIARPINSLVLFNQIVGRGMRGPKVGGKESFTLVQVIDRIDSSDAQFDPYSNYHYWDEFWENRE